MNVYTKRDYFPAGATARSAFIRRPVLVCYLRALVVVVGLACGLPLLRAKPAYSIPILLSTGCFVLSSVLSSLRFIRHFLRLRLPEAWGGYNLVEASALIETVIERPKQLRHLFLNDEVMRVFPSTKSHSHPTAASVRTATNIFLNDLVTRMGFDPYNVSCSPTDVGRGTRLFYGAKDLATEYRHDTVKINDVLIFVDVDYYTDMNKWACFFRPMLLYTFCPSTVTGRSTDYSYRFLSNNEVEFRVSGGSSYQHPLWDYTGDTFSVTDNEGCLCVFHIEQRNIPNDPDHKFVCLVPMARLPSCYAKFLPDTTPIKRKQVVEGKSCRLYDSVTDKLSIGTPGGYASVELTGTLYESLRERMNNKLTPPLVSDVERMLMANRDKHATINAPLLFNHLDVPLRNNVVSTNGSVNYHCIGPLATEDPKPLGRSVTTPVVSEPALIPNRGYNADSATIAGRVDKVRNEREPPRKYKLFAAEFVRAIVGDAGVGVPLSAEDVNKAQSSTQQRARFQTVKDLLTTNTTNRLESFMKVEAYPSINDPRNITTMSHELTIMLSAYTLAFKSDCLKNKVPWYGPGLNPSATVAKLKTLAGEDLDWLVVDYSRLDGTISKWMQDKLSNAMYMRWVRAEYRPELKHLLDQVFIQRGKTSNGVAFNPGYGTRSGSPQTTDGNTAMCAFVVYCSLRKLGLIHSKAWDHVGLVYGDDGLIPAYPGLAEMMEETAKDLGLLLKCEIKPRGEPVPYLGRYFIDPATTKTSFQDPLRTLSKLHLTAQRNVTLEQAAANRAHGYLATDSKTPLIGTWCKRVIAITGLKTKNLDRETQHRMSNAWYQGTRDEIYAPMAKVMGISEEDLRKFDDEMEAVTSLDAFPVLIETVRDVKISAVVDGTVVQPENRIDNEPKQQPNRDPSGLRQMESANSPNPGASHQTAPRRPRSPRNASVKGERRDPPSRRQPRVRDSAATVSRPNSVPSGRPQPGLNPEAAIFVPNKP